MQVLQVNMYYEKIYLFIWFWMFAIAIATLASIARWIWLLFPVRRRMFVRDLLLDSQLNWYAAGREPNRNRKPIYYRNVNVKYNYLGVSNSYEFYDSVPPASNVHVRVAAFSEISHTYSLLARRWTDYSYST